MINNNPYNIPQKKNLSQSKIFSESNNTNHTSLYRLNRGNNQMLSSSSSVLLKNMPVTNGNLDHSFYEPGRQPLSPHSIFPKHTPNSQIIPNFNTTPIRHGQINFFPAFSTKDINYYKGLNELKEKIEKIEKKMQLKDKTEIFTNENKQQKTIVSDFEVFRQFLENNLNKNTLLKSVVNSCVNEIIEIENRKVWSKLKNLQQTLHLSIKSFNSEKFSREEQLHKFNSEKSPDDQILSRIKAIQKTIRQMGQDIHLINDKEENLTAKIEQELPRIQNQIKNLKTYDKKFLEVERKNYQLRSDLENISRRLHLKQSPTQSIFGMKIKQIEEKIEGLKNYQKSFKASFERSFSEPIVLKYLQKFQVFKEKGSKNSQTNSTKQESWEEISVNQVTYYIDPEGYLLDNDRYYLINSIRNQRVRLEAKHLQLLKERKILI